MITVQTQIQNSNLVICQNIGTLKDQRALLSQNILAQLRNLVEGVAVLLHKSSFDAEFNFHAVEPGLSFVRSNGKLNFLGRFHKLIQISASHYTLHGDGSERLMLKYYEYLHRIRALLHEKFSFDILTNLEDFPVDLDPSLREYHNKIAARIEAVRKAPAKESSRQRYYIHKVRPFFVGYHVYYEVTFYRAVNKVSKFDRVIAFTDIDMTDKYAAMLMLERDSIEVLDQHMPIMIIRAWEVSIRPCEFDNFSRLLGLESSVKTNTSEYRFLMSWLTGNSTGLLDIVDMPDRIYNRFKEAATSGGELKHHIFNMLDAVRYQVSSRADGINVLRYLMLRMYNQNLKAQYNYQGCDYLSGNNLKWGCIPFDTMPFCTSLPAHNPRFWDLAESLDSTGREHELLARRVRNNVERSGLLYTPLKDLEGFGNVDELIAKHNSRLYKTHKHRELELDKGHVFISGYENDTVAIVEELQDVASVRIENYTESVERWLKETPLQIDDPVKEDVLKRLFSQSKVALIYGAAGTGKSTMLNHVANHMNSKSKLFLAHTNPAIDNLKRKVTAQNSEFRTISSQIYRADPNEVYDLLVIDECSTVSNADMLKVLKDTHYRLLVLVGDVYQIESIQFGNWFDIIRSLIPPGAVFELTTPFRTKSDQLLDFWNKVRGIEDDIAEVMARNNYSTVLDKGLFNGHGQDEIILCLNYDGLYGINNINRFLQSRNPGAVTTWGESTYKVGDPVLFHDSERFRPLIYNNLKGTIVRIEHAPGWIQFDVNLDTHVNDFDVNGLELEWVEGSTVRFTVFECGSGDDDDDSLNITVPFQVAYAVSIHKAQGLEYDSVKVVVTDANEDDITHSIFYTAVTRARERLLLFWTPETEHSVLKKLACVSSSRDVSLLSSRRGFKPGRR